MLELAPLLEGIFIIAFSCLSIAFFIIAVAYFIALLVKRRRD